MITGIGGALALVGALTTAAVAASVTGGSGFGDEHVGTTYANGMLLPTNQWVKPIGTRLLVKDGRLVASSISPNGQYMAALTWNDFTGFLTMIDLKTGKVIQQVGTGVGSDHTIGDGSVAADGPLWSPDGSTLWVPQTADLLRFSVGSDGMVAANPVSITLEQNGANSTADLPSGMALSQDGS